MKLFDVYPLFNIELSKAQGSYVWDKSGKKYLDMYGGHAVISIGHSHPSYIQKITEQLNLIGFYSNSVQNSLQTELAEKLGKISGYPDYQLFLCNSGAEANENAMKLASFHTGKKKMIAFEKGFHGRTSLAVASTDDKKITAPINETENVSILPFNDEKALQKAFSENNVAGVIIEGIQGVGGVNIPSNSFLKAIKSLCLEFGALMISDEIQSGYGRTGKFFAHQHAGIEPDLITIAKGMGNGFPVAGVIIHPKIAPQFGMLGTTFGGNYLASVASIAVIDTIEKEKLITNAETIGNYLINELKKIQGIKQVRGQGLMIGIEFENKAQEIRKTLLNDYQILTGASGTNTIRLLPALSIGKTEINQFLTALKETIKYKILEQV